MEFLRTGNYQISGRNCKIIPKGAVKFSQPLFIVLDRMGKVLYNRLDKLVEIFEEKVWIHYYLNN